MKLKTILLGLMVGLFSIVAVAGGGHDHGYGHSHSHGPVDQDIAKVNATKIVHALANRKVVDESWLSVAEGKAEKKVFKGNPEWVVTFLNNKLADKEKRKLYIFLTLGGDYIAANYTGK